MVSLVSTTALCDEVKTLMPAPVRFRQVTRSGLLNACGIAGIMLTTQAVMVETRKPKAAAGGGGGGGGGMGGGMMQNGMPAGLTM